MTEVVNFDECTRIDELSYGGNAGQKRAYAYSGTAWMVKFPENTRSLQGKHLPSYTSSPISEYIGSHIYASLGIPVHDTVLGVCAGKVVVGCRDFSDRGDLIAFGMIKNSVDEELLSGELGSTTRGERLSDVMRVLEHAPVLRSVRDAVRERFWDMFVTDAFILNNDRNNGNWGVLRRKFGIELAPVFDNGNCLFNKRNPSVAGRRILDEALIEEDARNGRSFFMTDDDHHIHPLQFIETMANEECNRAVLRFAERIDMGKVDAIIDGIPRSIIGLPVITVEQRALYKGVLHAAAEKWILPTAGKIMESAEASREAPSLDEETHASAVAKAACLTLKTSPREQTGGER